MWWLDVLIGLFMLAAAVSFVLFARDRTRSMSSRTERTAESMYGIYADRRAGSARRKPRPRGPA